MIKSLINLEEYKKYFKQSYYTNQYDLDKIVKEMFEIRQELWRVKCRKNG